MKRSSISEAYEAFKLENCVFVISADDKGKPSGMVAAWVMKCSMDPPLLAVSLSKKGYTQQLIRQNQAFVVAVPNKDLEDEVVLFGTTHGNEVDKFAETGIETSPAENIQLPLIKKATVNFECDVFKEVDAGDHILFIGKILAAYVNEDKKILLSLKKADGKRVFEEY